MLNKKLLIIFTIIICSISVAFTTVYATSVPIEINETTFPDPNFRAIVLADYSDGNGHVDVSVTEIYVDNQNIASLAGIEYFPELTLLYCSNNQLTSLDLSQNTRLDLLNCDNNQLTSLDLSACTALTYLTCTSNSLTKLDLSHNAKLDSLFCYSNQLTALDVPNNPYLHFLFCQNNNLATLDVSNIPYLLELEYNNNALSSLDLSNNSGLMDHIREKTAHVTRPLDLYMLGSVYWINLKDLPYSNLIDFNRVTMTNTGSLNVSNGIVTFSTIPSAIAYEYDVPSHKNDFNHYSLSVKIPISNHISVDSSDLEAYIIKAMPASHGTISVSTTIATPGSLISVTINPESGYQLKEGSLKYNTTAIHGMLFTMPNQNVTISCEFEAIPEVKIEPIVFSGYVDLGYRKTHLFSNDNSVPPIPKNVHKQSTNANYAQELMSWADALGYDLSGLDLETLLDIPFAMPYMTTDNEIVFEVSQTQTVKDIMADIIMLGKLQEYIIAEEAIAIDSGGSLQILNDSTTRMLEYLERYHKYISEKPAVKYNPRTVASGLSVINEIIKSTWFPDLNTSLIDIFANVVISTNPEYNSVINALHNVDTDQELIAAQDGIINTVGFGIDVYKLVNEFLPNKDAAMWDLFSWDNKLASTDFIYDIAANTLQDKYNPGAYALLEFGKLGYDFLKATDKAFGPVTKSVKLFATYLRFAVSCIQYIEEQYPSWLFYTHYYVLPNYPQYFKQIGFNDKGIYDFDAHVNIANAKVNCDELAYTLLGATVWSEGTSRNLFGSQKVYLSDSERRILIANALTLAEIRHTNYKDAQRYLLEYIFAQVNATEEPAAVSVNCPVEVQLIDANGDIAFSLNTNDEYSQNYTGFCTYYLSGDDRDQKNLIISGDYDVKIIPLENGTMTLSINPSDNSNTEYTFGPMAITTDDIYLLKYESDHTPYLQKISAVGDIQIIKPSSTVVLPNRLIISEDYIEIYNAETYSLSCEVDPSSLADITVHWTSTDPAIASVDQNGFITANAPGNAVISASFGTTAALCKVTVLPRDEDLVSMSFSTSIGGTIYGDFEDAYVIGSQLSFIAKADDGYAFLQWEPSDNQLIGSLDSPIASITIPSTSQSIRASFEPVTTYYLNVLDIANGTILMNPSGYYQAGDQIVLSILSEQDHYFKEWTSTNGGEFIDPTSVDTIFTMPSSNTTITATLGQFGDLIPQTRDHNHYILWIAVACFASTGIITLILKMHHRRYKRD